MRHGLRLIGGLLLLGVLLVMSSLGPSATASRKAPAGPALTATVEWTILAPSPPGPAHTLLFEGDTPGIGPIEHPNCATWDAATHVLTLYDTATGRLPRQTCYPATKTIRRNTPTGGLYALTWPEGAGPFWEWLVYPGDTYPAAVQLDGGIAVALP